MNKAKIPVHFELTLLRRVRLETKKSNNILY